MTWMLLSFVFLLALWVLLRFLPAGADGHRPLPYLIALTPFLWIPAASAALLAGILGDRAPTIPGTLLALTVLGLEFAGHHRHRSGEGTGGTRRPSDKAAHRPGPGRTLQLMTLNCRRGRADPDAVVAQVRRRSVDVLALQELTDGLVDGLEKAGLGSLLPHRQLGRNLPDDNGGFNGVWSRSAPSGTENDATDIPAADTPSLTLPLTGRPVRFVSAHTKSPHRGCRQWSQGIMGLGALADPSRRQEIVILGDLNSSLDHPSFRALLRSGLRDAALAQGTGPVASYPAWLPWPRIELDHVLTTPGIETADVVSTPVPGTDHLAVCARLSL